MTCLPHSRRPHPRHRRRRRNRRSSEGDRRRPRAAGVAGRGAQARRAGQRRQIARRNRVARHRQFPQLALPRPGKAAFASVSASRPRTPITARSAARARSAICMKPPSASRAANAASPRSAAPRRNPPRPRPSAPASTLPWTPFAHDVPEAKRGAAFQKPMAVKLGVFRPVTVYPFYEAALGALGPDPARGDGGIRPIYGRPIPASHRKIPMPG